MAYLAIIVQDYKSDVNGTYPLSLRKSCTLLPVY